MATEINAGRVAMVPKGEWSASTAYVRLDVVYYNGSSYVASQDSTGQNPSTATNYWQLLARGVDPSNYYTKTETNTKLGSKQDALVSGQNIKSINGQSVLGEGNLELGELFVVTMTRHNSVYTADKSVSEIYAASYTNGKPVIAVMRDISNPVFILADCNPDGDSYVFSAIESNTVTTLRWQRTDDYTYELETMALQPHLVSGTNIKTVNNESLLGSGNVTIAGKSAYQSYVDTTTDNPPKTEAEWVASLKGEDGVSLGEVAIADDLDTDDARKVLSARQGYNLGQKVNDVDAEPTAGSEKFVKSGGVQNELALGAVYDVSAKNPTAGINNDGKWESLSTLLSDANLNNLIPTSVRKGGMSIKFVQSSDNKYVQARCMAQNFTTDVTQWSIAEEGVYVENPEFVYVKTDKDGKILWAIKIDGGIYYGAGVPQQVIDYIDEKIAELSLDEYEDIVAFLNGLEEGDKTLQTLLNEKVDKEEGKSLIDADYASSQSAIDNPEYLQVTTDNEDKILEGIKQDGTKVIGRDLNVGGSTKILGEMEVAGVSYKVVENPEYIAAWIDAEYKVIFGLKADGKTYVGDADFLNDIEDIKAFIQNTTDKNIDWDALSSITTVENPEFIEAKTDSEGKLLAGRTPDGAAFENVGFTTPKVSIDGHTIKNIKDPEGRTEITTDVEGKIISYRDSDGVKHEEVGIETERAKINHLVLTESGMNEFQQALINSGFNPKGISDWSAKTELHIGEPYCARVNFSGIDAMPTTKTDDAHAYMEFWDMGGNYFKKEVILNAQGRSSLSHPKKNLAIDICNNNGWDDDDTFKLQIGDWIPQDSFHLKAFYNDPFRCLSPVAYRLNDEILKTRGEYNDYVWKRALLDLGDITPTSTGCADAEEAIEGWNTNARCFPMGFPCIVYLNGDFYGIYSWQLKKHRDNYMMSKKKTKHIHLDGLVNPSTILNADGDSSQIVWTTNTPEGIEIRNPKPKKKKDDWDMTIMDGTKYDADANGGELIDSTSPNWDATNESHVKSAEVKQYILNLSKVIPALADAYSTYQASSKTDEDKAAFKEVLETYFDVDNLIDYLIFSDVLANYDGFGQNVQWITYNGVKWYLCAYDLDGVMGNWWQLNDTIVAPVNAHYSFAQFQYIPIFYNAELEARYKELRDMGIISVSNIINLVENWLKRIGAKETFEKEWEKWSGFIKNDNIHRLYKWLLVSISNMDVLYNYN